jgi:hypothetical protein
MKFFSPCGWLAALVFLLAGNLAAARADALGPASKRTALVISEVMYHPATRADGKNVEFIEIYNSEAVPKDIGGFRVEGDVSFVFPAGTTIGSLGFVVVAAAPADVQSVYGLTGVFGPFEERKSLPNGSGRLELWSRSGGLLLEMDYEDSDPWPVAADGAGHSIVLARPTFGQDSPKAWAACAVIGGSPGAKETGGADPLAAVAINEILAHTEDATPDFVELYNRSSSALNLSGCVLTDNPATNRFVIGEVTIPAGGFVSFTQAQMGFALNAAGETVYLKNPAGTRVLDAVRFGAQEDNVSYGRFPNGGPNFYRLESKTAGAPNSPIRQDKVVINELMYSPISGDDRDQYVELYNSDSTSVNVGGWRLSGGIEFVIPNGTTLPAGGYLVIAKDAAQLATHYTNLNSGNLVGDFSGKLAGSGERIVLSKPATFISTNAAQVVTSTNVFIAVDEVNYATGGRWSEIADGGGSSLELIDARANRRLASNWAESDETRKAPWTMVEHTGVLDNGAGAADQLQVFMQGAGEALLDDVEVIGAGGANLIANSTFETGAAGWVAEGTQDESSIENAEGFNSARSYHVRASDRGDTGANRIRTPLTSNLAVGSTATIRAKVRWLKGHPEMLLRIRGNYLEAIGLLNVPLNLGTPGLANSRARANVAPAIYDVAHAPVLPAANQAFVVTARVEDPDQPAVVQLNYRIDPAAAYTVKAMSDNGTGGDAVAGDGIYSASIPGAALGSVIAFYVSATDSLAAQARFPSDAPARECLVRIGETQPAGALGTYRLWMTAATRNTWTSRSPLNNKPFDVTFVYGNERVIYNMKALYAGSPYISPGYNGPAGSLCGYTGEFPKDDLFLGVNDFVLDWPGRDNAAISEQISYYIADQVGLPNSHRRFIHLHVNGVNEQSRGSVYEDVQQPGGDMIKQWSPDDAEGHFYKIERWFEFTDTLGVRSDPQPELSNYVTTGGAKKLARYRWNFLPRAINGSANDFDDIFALVDAVNATAPEPYTSQTEALVDIEKMMGMFAMERVINNFDSWGHQIGKNMYAYKPENGKWFTFMFDNDWLMIPSDGFGYNTSSDLFTPCSDPAIARMYNHPPFRRAFFRTIQRAVDALAPEKINPLMDAKYAALTSNGVTRSAGSALVAPTAVKTWLANRRAYMASQLATIAAPFAITSNGGADFETTTNVVTLTGTAPIEVTAIEVNGVAYPLQWTAVNAWSMRVPISAASTRLDLQAKNISGGLVAAGQDSVTVTFNGVIESPVGRIVFNEIMYNPTVSGGSFVELRSLATSTTFDLSNWRIEGVGFTFAPGTLLPPGGYLVVAKNRAVFLSSYGSSIPLAGEFSGQLQNGGETLWLVKPGATPAQDMVIDQVTYSDSPPWPTAADGLGGSLQLIDATQSNARALNWGAVKPSTNSVTPQTLVPIGKVWSYNQSGTDLGTSWIEPAFNDAAWPAGPALLYVEGSDLPAPKSTPLNIGPSTYYFRAHFNFSGDVAQIGLNISTVIDDGVIVYLNGHELYRLGMTDPVSYGTFSSRLVDNAAFEGPFSVPSQWLKNGDNVLAAEVHQNNAGSSDIVFGLALETAPPKAPTSTPGTANSVARALPGFPNVWINEVQPVNVTGILNDLGQRSAWVELFNGASTNVSLDGWALSDSATNLARWIFPNGAMINAGQRLLVWLDAKAGATQLHANFVPSATSGALALSFPFEGKLTALDYVEYRSVPSDRSAGRFPDGDDSGLELFFHPTPGAANDDAVPAAPLFINEWMASNTSIADPTDKHFDDWFEIYNPNAAAVDLTGYQLTDNLADSRERYVIPNGWSIGPGQFMLVWADGDSPTNATQLHVPFKLDRAGESIGLFAPNGSLIDSITFGSQTNNISQGRYPDGGGELRYYAKATPGTSNSPTLELDAPTLDTAGNIVIRWQSEPGRIYRVQFKTDIASATWSDLGEATATGATSEKIDASSGDTARFYRIQLEP